MSLFELFYTFFKIGLFTFGGGYGTIPLIEGEIVNKGYLDANLFLNFVGIAESTPGPFAINIATFIGAENYGFFGSLLATVAVISPAFIIMLIMSALLKNFSSNKWVKGFMQGVQPFVIGLIISTGLLIIIKCLYVNFGDFTALPTIDVTSLIVTAIIIASNIVYKIFTKKNLPAILLILISAILGLMFF